MATIVNVQDPVSGYNLAVNSLGQIGVSNFPSVQTITGTVNVALFPAVQTVNGTVDVSDRALRLVGIVSLAAGSSILATTPTAGATLTNVAASTSSVSILPANANRKGMLIYNDSSSAMYVAYAASASTSNYSVKIPANSLFAMPSIPVYTGAMSAVWDTATGNARVTELS